MGVLGKYLQQARQKRGMTVRALAEEIKKSAGYISRIEVRDEIPSSELLCQISMVLGEKPEILLDLAKSDLLCRAKKQIEQKSSEALSLFRRSR